MNKAFFLILILLVSCTKRHEVIKKKSLHFVKGVISETSEPKEIPWKVGLKKEMEISKGFLFYIQIPILEEEGIETLKSRYGINSWVFRVVKLKNGQEDIIDYSYANLTTSAQKEKRLNLRLYYSAAAVSKQFRSFHCPAFKHRKRIESITLKKIPSVKPTDIFTKSYGRLGASPKHLRFSFKNVEAGSSMYGDYFVEYALYNSKTKKRYSRWLKSDHKIVISKETSNIIPSCAGINEEVNPLPQSIRNKDQILKF